jgi:hypothetical protein
MLVCRPPVLADGIHLYGKTVPCPALGLPFCQTTEMAARLIRVFQPPAGVKVMVVFDAYYVCRTVVQTCREPKFHCTSTLQSHRRLCTQGWQRNAGRDGQNLFRRRRTTPLALAKPQGQTRDRFVAAGWLEVSTLGLVTDAPGLSAAGLVRMYDNRWAVEPFFKDSMPLLGLGPYQNRPDWAAVTHRHLVCFADALLTHWRLERDGAQGQWTRKTAADLSTAAAQNQLRRLLWEDLLTSLREASGTARHRRTGEALRRLTRKNSQREHGTRG